MLEKRLVLPCPIKQGHRHHLHRTRQGVGQLPVLVPLQVLLVVVEVGVEQDDRLLNPSLLGRRLLSHRWHSHEGGGELIRDRHRHHRPCRHQHLDL